MRKWNKVSRRKQMMNGKSVATTSNIQVLLLPSAFQYWSRLNLHTKLQLQMSQHGHERHHRWTKTLLPKCGADSSCGWCRVPIEFSPFHIHIVLQENGMISITHPFSNAAHTFTTMQIRLYCRCCLIIAKMEVAIYPRYIIQVVLLWLFTNCAHLCKTYYIIFARKQN